MRREERAPVRREERAPVNEFGDHVTRDALQGRVPFPLRRSNLSNAGPAFRARSLFSLTLRHACPWNGYATAFHVDPYFSQAF